ncbi:MAG TPA: hypothetical protein VHT29_03405 [Solirubrobacteraceae bacterium]|nr:hypothetical protein [Solirubrobacteraceae bacterium]
MGMVDVFKPAGEFVEQFASPSPAGVAVGVAGTAAAGEVYVTEDVSSGSVVHVYDPSKGNELVRSFGSGVLNGEANGVAVAPGAVAPGGDVYVTVPPNEVVEFTASGECVVVGCPAFATGTSDGVGVDPGPGAGEGDVYIADGTSIAEYSAAGVLLGSFGGERAEFGGLVGAHGVAVDGSSGEVFTADYSVGRVDAFGLGPEPGVPVTLAASGVLANSAVLHGSLDPAGVRTSYYWRYNTDGGCEGGSRTGVGDGGEGSGSEEESLEATGLVPLTKYSFCFVAENAFGAGQGTVLSFETPAAKPAIESVEAHPVSPFVERLEGTVNPENQATASCVFEYGTTISYGSSRPCEPASLSGFGPQTVTASVAGLESATPYFYRLLVSNPTGSSETAGTFTTSTAQAPAVAGESASGLSFLEPALEGAVNPEFQATSYEFEYATSEQAITEAKASVVHGSSGLPAVSESLAVSARVQGLPPGPVFYRLVATNATGTTDGTIEQFLAKGAPAAETGGSRATTATTSIVSGSIDPQGAGTRYHFAYITQAAYQTAVEHGENPYAHPHETYPQPLAGADYTTHPVEETVLEELAPGETYRYELVATNELATTTGTEQTLTTTPGPTPPPSTGSGPGAPTFSLTFTIPPTPAPIPYTTITQLDQQETRETPKTHPTPTRQQLLNKALHACHKKHGHNRHTCETHAHHKYNPTPTKHK